MGWNIIRNSEPDFREDSFSGMCPRFSKEATITIATVGSMICKTDLQKTYRKIGLKCSLLEGTKEASYATCMENCFFEPEKYL